MGLRRRRPLQRRPSQRHGDLILDALCAFPARVQNSRIPSLGSRRRGRALVMATVRGRPAKRKRRNPARWVRRASAISHCVARLSGRAKATPTRSDARDQKGRNCATINHTSRGNSIAIRARRAAWVVVRHTRGSGRGTYSHMHSSSSCAGVLMSSGAGVLASSRAGVSGKVVRSITSRFGAAAGGYLGR